MVVILLLGSKPLWIALLAGLILGPVGYLAGRTARLKWTERQAKRYGHSATA